MWSGHWHQGLSAYEYGFIEVQKIVDVCKYCSMNLFNDVMNR